ncbi:MAG TPA: TldD/PmbA family protein [Planctomycetota bacterium]|nr:TldD/PmbA family protein [Planctomycetota bacterium]
MIERDRIFELAASLVDRSPADDTEVFFHEDEHNLTRFANNTIHQNVSVTNAEVLVRVAFGKKVGVACTNVLDGAHRALDEACAIARVSEDSSDYAGLPGPVPATEPASFDEATASCDAAERARRVAVVVDEAKKVEALAAGALSTGAGQSALVNSNGVRVHHRGTEANLNMVMMKGGGSGTTVRLGWKLSAIDEREAAAQTAERAVKTDNPRDVEPGEYPVVLEPQAVAVLVKFLAYVGFGGKAYHEKRSFMWGKMGFAVTGPLITIVDDGLDPAGIPMPFDYEGVPKKRVVLLRKGVAAGVCHDTASAALEHTESTGHALPANSSFGPMPLNLAMEPGDADLDALVRSTAKGLLVCNFHYTNVAERMRAVLTGMTRFGVFLIRDGEIAHPVKNLRWTQSVLDAFDAVSAVGADRQLVSGFGGGMLVPALKCDAFNFTGKTEF